MHCHSQMSRKYLRIFAQYLYRSSVEIRCPRPDDADIFDIGIVSVWQEWRAGRALPRERASGMGPKSFGFGRWVAWLLGNMMIPEVFVQPLMFGFLDWSHDVSWIFMVSWSLQINAMRLLAEDPRWPDSHHWRARSLVRLQQRQEARKALKLAQLCAEERSSCSTPDC